MNVRRFVPAVAFAALAAGLGTAVPAQAAPHHHAQLRIGAVQYDSPGWDTRSSRSLNSEWIEVTNSGRHAVNLRGYTLRDRDGNRYRFRDLRLGGHRSVRVHTGVGRDSRRDVYQDRRSYVWNNNGDTATLRDRRGQYVDSRSWGHHR